MAELTVDKQHCVGIFDTVEQADRAVRSLLAAGFTRDQLAVLCSDKSREQLFDNLPPPKLADTHPGASFVEGGAIGAMVGGLLLAATAIGTGGVGLLAAGTVLVGGGRKPGRPSLSSGPAPRTARGTRRSSPRRWSRPLRKRPGRARRAGSERY